MKRLKKLLKNNSGESMTELIVSFTIFMLALAVLTSMVTLGLKFNRMAADADKKYYGDFDEADGMLTVTITPGFTLGESVSIPDDIEIPYYKNDAGLIYFSFGDDEDEEEAGSDSETEDTETTDTTGT